MKTTEARDMRDSLAPPEGDLATTDEVGANKRKKKTCPRLEMRWYTCMQETNRKNVRFDHVLFTTLCICVSVPRKKKRWSRPPIYGYSLILIHSRRKKKKRTSQVAMFYQRCKSIKSPNSTVRPVRKKAVLAKSYREIADHNGIATGHSPRHSANSD